MKPRTAMGVAMMTVSLAFFAGGAFVVKETVDMKEREARQWAETDRQCLQLLNTLPSVAVAPSGKDVTVTMGDVADPRKALSDATVAAMMCPGKQLSEVCLGDKCVGAQGKVILRFKLKGA